jgi:transposase
MEVVFPTCCGLDIHKNTITACVLLSAGSRKQKQLQRFGTVAGELRRLAAWLHQFGVVQVAMESTGVYWKPIWNILEGDFELCLVNAQHVKNVPGRKTDLKDCDGSPNYSNTDCCAPVLCRNVRFANYAI